MYANARIDECSDMAHSAYERSSVSYTYEQDIERIADLVVELVSERVMDRIWKMIDDAKAAPSEKEFLTGIERLFSQ